MSEKKTPKDHQQPKDRPKHVTVMGVDLVADPGLFDDLEIVELLSDMNAGTAEGSFAIVPLLKRVTGDEYAAVKDALRDPDTGRVPIEAVGEFIKEFVKELAPNS